MRKMLLVGTLCVVLGLCTACSSAEEPINSGSLSADAVSYVELSEVPAGSETTEKVVEGTEETSGSDAEVLGVEETSASTQVSKSTTSVVTSELVTTMTETTVNKLDILVSDKIAVLLNFYENELVDRLLQKKEKLLEIKDAFIFDASGNGDMLLCISAMVQSSDGAMMGYISPVYGVVDDSNVDLVYGSELSGFGVVGTIDYTCLRYKSNNRLYLKAVDDFGGASIDYFTYNGKMQSVWSASVSGETGYVGSVNISTEDFNAVEKQVALLFEEPDVVRLSDMLRYYKTDYDAVMGTNGVVEFEYNVRLSTPRVTIKQNDKIAELSWEPHCFMGNYVIYRKDGNKYTEIGRTDINSYTLQLDSDAELCVVAYIDASHFESSTYSVPVKYAALTKKETTKVQTVDLSAYSAMDLLGVSYADFAAYVGDDFRAEQQGYSMFFTKKMPNYEFYGTCKDYQGNVQDGTIRKVGVVAGGNVTKTIKSDKNLIKNLAKAYDVKSYKFEMTGTDEMSKIYGNIVIDLGNGISVVVSADIQGVPERVTDYADYDDYLVALCQKYNRTLSYEEALDLYAGSEKFGCTVAYNEWLWGEVI